MTKKELDILNNGKYVLIDTSIKNVPDIIYGKLYNPKEPNACIIALISILSNLIYSIEPPQKNDIGFYNKYTDKLVAAIRHGIKAAVDLKINMNR